MGWFPFSNKKESTEEVPVTGSPLSSSKVDKLSSSSVDSRKKNVDLDMKDTKSSLSQTSPEQPSSSLPASSTGNEDQDKSTNKSYLFGLVTEVNPGGINNMYKINIPGVKSTNDNTKCVNMVNQSIKEQKIQFLAKSLDELGCSFSWSDMIECEPCTELCHAMFHGNDKGLKEGEYKPKLTVCENYMISKAYTTRAIAHELIHAYDQCRAKVDYQNIEHLACTEIRAAALSGDCDMAAEFDRGNFKLKGQHQACVKRRAIAAITTGNQNQNKIQIETKGKNEEEKNLLQRPIVDEVEATLAVEKVWSECYKDTNPFPGIPPP